jgi:hypothetical protein
MAKPTSDAELRQARDRFDAAATQRQEAQREVDEIGLAYAAAQERLRTAESGEAEARAALQAAEKAATRDAG